MTLQIEHREDALLAQSTQIEGSPGSLFTEVTIPHLQALYDFLEEMLIGVYFPDLDALIEVLETWPTFAAAQNVKPYNEWENLWYNPENQTIESGFTGALVVAVVTGV